MEAEGRVRARGVASRPSRRCGSIAATSRGTNTPTPSFFFPELAARRAIRRRWPIDAATLAAIFTDPRNGRMPRTIVNRIWTAGSSVAASSRTRTKWIGRPWSPALLDWLAADFVDARLRPETPRSRTIVTSRAYQMAAVPRTRRSAGARLRSSAVRRSAASRAEQFADAIGSITGEWSTYNPPGADGSRTAAADRGRTPTRVTSGVYAREFRAPPRRS